MVSNVVSIFMDAWSGRYFFVRRIIDENGLNLYANIFVRLCPFLSDHTGTLRWKTSLPYPKFFHVCAGTYQEI